MFIILTSVNTVKGQAMVEVVSTGVSHLCDNSTVSVIPAGSDKCGAQLLNLFTITCRCKLV